MYYYIDSIEQFTGNTIRNIVKINSKNNATVFIFEDGNPNMEQLQLWLDEGNELTEYDGGSN